MSLFRLKKLFYFLFIFISINLRSTIDGLWLPKIKPLTGQSEFSIGFHFWDDHLIIRNLQLRTYAYLLPGVRINSVLRGNKELNQIEYFRKNNELNINDLNPAFDELYLEFIAFYNFKFGKLSGNLKIGKNRYLRFPYYDHISKFDHVPGLEDLRGGKMTGYNGENLTLDFFSAFGLGAHSSIIKWNFYERRRLNFIENYIYYKIDYDWLNIELRTGYLQARTDQLGKSKTGSSVFLGLSWKGYQTGIYWENIGNVIFTGFEITFAPSFTTKLLGKVRLDYTRSFEGFVFQIPVLKQNFGPLQNEIPSDSDLVGKIEVERVITFHQAGLMRNFYEHIISQNGDTTSEDLIVRINEHPPHLAIESIVSPFYKFKKFKDIHKWDSQGPRLGQYGQRVTYEFYRIRK